MIISEDEATTCEILTRTDLEFRAAGRSGDVLLAEMRPSDLVVAPTCLLPALPVHRRLRLSAALADQNLALVAEPGRLTLTPHSLPNQMDRMLGQHH